MLVVVVVVVLVVVLVLVLVYFSRSAWTEAERRRGSMGDARKSRGANADAVVGGE